MLKVEKIQMDGKLREWLKKSAGIRAQVQVGVFENAKYADGTPVALVAFKNETGANRIPRRPFLRRTLKKNQRRWVRGIITNIKWGGWNARTVRRAYELCGQVAVGDVKQTIAGWPPGDPRKNSPKTIARKRARARKGKKVKAIDPERALIDTGTMINSISYEVTL